MRVGDASPFAGGAAAFAEQRADADAGALEEPYAGRAHLAVLGALARAAHWDLAGHAAIRLALTDEEAGLAGEARGVVVSEQIARARREALAVARDASIHEHARAPAVLVLAAGLPAPRAADAPTDAPFASSEAGEASRALGRHLASVAEPAEPGPERAHGLGRGQHAEPVTAALTPRVTAPTAREPFARVDRRRVVRRPRVRAGVHERSVEHDGAVLPTGVDGSIRAPVIVTAGDDEQEREQWDRAPRHGG